MNSLKNQSRDWLISQSTLNQVLSTCQLLARGTWGKPGSCSRGSPSLAGNLPISPHPLLPASPWASALSPGSHRQWVTRGSPNCKPHAFYLVSISEVHLALLFVRRFLCFSPLTQRAQDGREAEVVRRTGGSLAQRGLSSRSQSPWAALEWSRPGCPRVNAEAPAGLVEARAACGVPSCTWPEEQRAGCPGGFHPGWCSPPLQIVTNQHTFPAQQDG